MQSSASADRWCHSHILNEGNPLAERNTRWAILLTAVTMVAEIVGGWIYIFFFNDAATSEIYTLSLHVALPIWLWI